MSKHRAYYVVWNGHNTGVFDSWEKCQAQIAGCKQALYKAFPTLEEAQRAYASHPSLYIGKKEKPATAIGNLPAAVDKRAIAVDAACSGNPGQMEYRGVLLENGREIFHFGPRYGTNNIGEFLAIVHALALLEKRGLDLPIYSDSRNAILWVQSKQCKTKLPRDEKSEELFDLIARAEGWLRSHPYHNSILKWETGEWGEIPADFGRK